MQRTTGSGLLLVLLSQTALAADPPRASPPDPARPAQVSWSGAYGGLFAGYGALGSATRFICADQAGGPGEDCPVLPSRTASDGSFIAGGEIGYTWQAPLGLVAGAAADYQPTRLWGYGRQQGDFRAVDGLAIPKSVANFGQRLDDLATVRGKLGFALDRTFVYATAGLAVGNVRIDNNLSLILRNNLNLPPAAAFDGRSGAVRLGYVVGAGIEHALSAHLSAKIEGLYYDLGSRAVLPGQTAGDLPGYRAGTRVATDGFLTRAGLNYRFGDGLPDLPPAGAAGPATWAFEGGLRYFYSSGSPRETLNDNYRPGQVNSRLIYGDAQAHAGESFARLAHNPTGLFVKGFLGTGGVTGGRLSDADFPPAIDPYSRTISTIRDGDISYGAIDFGYDLLRRDEFKLGGFFGYQSFSELYNGYGCRQVAASDGCVPSYPASLKGLGENMQWNALRVGLIGEARLDRVRLSLEGAYLPVVAVDGVDRHWIRPEINPGSEGGRGDGYFLEGIITYDLTPSVSVGVGGRYWRMQADRAHAAFPLQPPSPIRFETERYGGFVQLSYRLADFGLGEAGVQPVLIRED